MDRAAGLASGPDADEMRRSMLGDLFGGVMYGLIELHTVAPRCTNRPSETPRAHSVAAFQAQSGQIVVNAHHTMFQLDAMATEVLKLSDGTRRRTEIVDVLVDWFEAGRLGLEDEGRPITDSNVARAALATRLEAAIATLTRSALLVA
jgi:methyltransferase-like protein